MSKQMTKQYYIVTYGCQMNQRDSRTLAGLLEEMGYHPCQDKKEADLILFNTCCVRENAERRVFGNIGFLRKHKEVNPDLIIGVCGCMMQQEGMAEKFAKRYPFVDLLFGTHNLHELPGMLSTVLEKRRQVVALSHEHTIHEDLPSARVQGSEAFVTIMYGCDNFCSYCIVPYVRGRERSREKQAILQELLELKDQGIQEVTLLGQNVNSYGKDLHPPLPFAQLLEEVDALHIPRIRFMTSHPKDVSPALIQTMANAKHIAHHIHLPVQAGSDRILAAMNRGYTQAQYLNLITSLREALPDVGLTTDLIVGFPGETQEDFEQTLHLVRQAQFDAAYTFLYSPREGTPAAAMQEAVPADVQKERIARLIALQEEIAAKAHQSLIGTQHEVLVEGITRKSKKRVHGKAGRGLSIQFEGSADLIGQIVPVRIKNVEGNVITGEIRET